MKEIQPTVRIRDVKNKGRGASFSESNELMDELENNPNVQKTDSYYYFNPIVDPDGKMYCFCHFELIKEDETTYHCTGGNRHRYAFDEGTLQVDKFGNILLAIPRPRPSTEEQDEKD